MGDWTFFSNYGHVLVCLARNREVRLRDVAAEVGITERAVQKIVRDLQEAGYLAVSKQGRCNRYRINRRKTLRHSLESHCTVGKLLTLISKPANVSPSLQQDPGSVETEAADGAGASGEDRRKVSGKPLKRPPDKQSRDASPGSAEEESSSRPLDTRQQGSLF